MLRAVKRWLKRNEFIKVSRRELELAMVRIGERYPDTVLTLSGVPGRGCFVDVVARSIGLRFGWVSRQLNPHGILCRDAYILNDRGFRWGQIPVRLGLVPGEQPAHEPVRNEEPARC